MSKCHIILYSCVPSVLKTLYNNSLLWWFKLFTIIIIVALKSGTALIIMLYGWMHQTKYVNPSVCVALTKIQEKAIRKNNTDKKKQIHHWGSVENFPLYMWAIHDMVWSQWNCFCRKLSLISCKRWMKPQTINHNVMVSGLQKKNLRYHKTKYTLMCS